MRSASEPRTPVPASIAAGSMLTRTLSSKHATSSPSAIRTARPRTTLVLPTPGAPIEARVVRVTLGEHVERALDLGVASDDRIELAARRELREVLSELRTRSGNCFGSSAKRSRRALVDLDGLLRGSLIAGFAGSFAVAAPLRLPLAAR